MTIKATATVAKFNCLQADCPDTCCKGWSMQVDDETFAKYKGTELENAIAYDGKDGEIRVMKRDAKTDYCVKFTDGICAIHKQYGAPRLGDACNFYPRITRNFDNFTIMTSTLSCPEITRLALFTDIPQRWQEIETERLPNNIINYQEPEIGSEQALKIHRVFLDSCDNEDPPSLIMSRIYSVALSLSRIAKKDWPDAAGFFLKSADAKLPKPVAEPEDKYQILQIFAALIHASGKKPSPRLMEVIERTEQNLGVKIDWETLELEVSGNPLIIPVNNSGILRKYLAAQLSFSSFPLAGLGNTIVDKAKLLSYKFALTKLLITTLSDESQIIQAIQSAARIIDHIASPELVFTLMDQFEWNSEARLRGLME